MLPSPRIGRCLSARTRDERAHGFGCVDCDGLESGGEEAFWWSIEAGGSPTWQETLSGELEKGTRRIVL